MLEIPRELKLPAEIEESIFLWGLRQAGKSYLLRFNYPNTNYINLLDSKSYFKYLKEPWLLRQEIIYQLKQNSLNPKHPIVIDEIQKIPALLDEVHLMIEEYKLNFILCGSSARKVKQGQANLLGGRALKYELYGLSAYELKENFDLLRMLNQGYLPKHYLSSKTKAKELWNSYISDYLKEEIAAEALVRNLPVFSEFLRAAAFSDSETVNYSNIARDCGVSSKTVKEYFHILEDTLIASFLPAYTARPKRKVIMSPKFYYADLGIVNALLKRDNLEFRSELLGKAFENWIYHELQSYNSYRRKFWQLSYWRLANGSAEVDFIINDMECAIEAKATDRVKKDELYGLRELQKDHAEIKRRILVSLVDQSRITEDGIEIVNYNDFISLLWSGKLDS